jgi:single-strand DNA-binding protein
MNRVIIAGNLGADPEVHYTGDGAQLAKFSVATTEVWNDTSGTREKVEWHKVVAFGKVGEACAKNLKKGAKVLLEGRLETGKWQSQDGGNRESTNIVALKVEFLVLPAMSSERKPLNPRPHEQAPRKYVRETKARAWNG